MPDPASSFMVGNAPWGASYAAPLLNFSELTNYPEQAFQGQQRARTTKLQNAFPNGLPRDPQGNIDVGQVGDTLTKLGGAEYASQLMPFLIESQMGQQGADAVTGAAPQPQSQPQPQPQSQAPSASVPNAAGPANIRGPKGAGSAAQSVPQPALSSAGTDDSGQDTVRSLTTELFGGKDVSPLIPRFAKSLGVDPDAPLSPEQVTSARAMIGRVQQRLSGSQSSDATGGGAPISPVGGTGGNGAPVAGTSPETAAPATGIDPNGPATSGTAGPASAAPKVPGVPPGYDPGAFANAMLARATAIRAQAARYAAFPNGANQATTLNNQAAMLEERAKQIFDFMGTAAQPTEVQKNVASGAASTNAAIEANAKSAQTQLAGIRGSASEYETDLRPKVELASSILNDPRTYTGTGGDFDQMLNRAKAVYGPTAPAQLQEMLSKVTASSILAQINGLKTQMMEAGGASSNAGRIFQQQVELMQKASPQLGTTLAGNRALVELERRAGDQAVAVRDLALNYLGPPDANGVTTNHKFLDAGFDKLVANYLQSHPLFTKEERANPALLGAPTAPPTLSNTADRVAWGTGIGLKPGDPFRVNGKYQYWKGAPQQ